MNDKPIEAYVILNESRFAKELINLNLVKFLFQMIVNPNSSVAVACEKSLKCSDVWSAVHFTNKFSIVIKIQWKLHAAYV